MAAEKNTDSVVLDVMERNWIRKSLETQRAVLVRSRAKESAGSPIWVLRGDEILALSNLLVKLS